MQSRRPPPWKARLFAMPSSGKPPRQIALYRLVCSAVKLSRVARRQPSADRIHSRRSIPHAVRAPTVEGLADSQCSAAQYGTTQRIHAARTNARLHRPCSARQAMQIRPELRCTGLADSPYIYHVQCITRAVCGHFKRFSGFPVNGGQRSAAQSRPPARNRPPQTICGWRRVFVKFSLKIDPLKF